MKSLALENWATAPELSKWRFIQPTEPTKQGCTCETKNGFLILQGHSSCPYGRIDTTICTECNRIVNYEIIR